MFSVTQALKEAIRQSGLSDRRLGMLTGIHRQSIGRFMAGQTGLRLDQIDTLAKFFKLELRPVDPPKLKKGRK